MADDKLSKVAPGSPGADGFDGALAKHAAATTGDVKSKGGRPRNDGLIPGSPEALAADQGTPARKRNSSSAAPVPARELFKPDSVRILVRLPFDVAAATTKSDTWHLDKDEEDALSVPGAMALNEWFPNVSPKWAALTAFSLALLAVAGRKYVTWQGEMKEKEVNNEG